MNIWILIMCRNIKNKWWVLMFCNNMNYYQYWSISIAILKLKLKHIQLVVQNRYLYTLSVSVKINEMTWEQHNQNNKLSNGRKKLQ